MPQITIDKEFFKKIGKLVGWSIPVISVLISGSLFIDNRYMMREISDTRYVETHIKIVQSDIREYQRHIQSGVVPTEYERHQHEIDQHQLRLLMEQRNKLLGLGDSE